MRIECLAALPGAVSLVAAWQHEAFGYLNPARTLEQRVQWLEESLRNDDCPSTLLALDLDGTPAGCASIVAATQTHRHLGPWLSMVYVRPERRRSGVASAMAARAVADCAHRGYSRVFLFTPRHEQLYSRLGWETFDRSEVGGLRVAVMKKSV